MAEVCHETVCIAAVGRAPIYSRE